MATLNSTPDQSSRSLQTCRVVAIPVTDLTDADTYVAGPGLVTVAWENGATGEGVGGWNISDRTTGTVTWDSGAAAQAGTMYLFYGPCEGGMV